MEDKMQKRFADVKCSKTFRHIADQFTLASKKVLDIGCGYGEYLDCFGEGSVGLTLSTKEVKYAKARGLMVMRGNAEQIDTLNLPRDFEIIWVNNLFEHLLSPHAFLLKLKTITTPNTILILGVPILPLLSYIMKVKKFKGALVSNHINFFTEKTLVLTVLRAGWEIEQARSFVFRSKSLDRLFSLITPHMYIVARNNELFQYPPKKVLEWQGEQHYGAFLNITNQT